MKTVFDPSVRNEIIHRIETLTETSTRKWGKMDVCQMLHHCILWEEALLRNKKYKRVFIGRVIGKLLLKKELKDDSPLRRNTPTIPELKVEKTTCNIDLEKKKWISLIKEYEHYTLPDYSFIHPFFGKMTKEEIGYHTYKHMDHHLRQFGS